MNYDLLEQLHRVLYNAQQATMMQVVCWKVAAGAIAVAAVLARSAYNSARE